MSEALAEAKALLRAATGVDVPAYREPLLRAELDRLGRGELASGLARLRGGEAALLEELAGTFAVGETYLFRTQEHFRELRRLARAAAAREQGACVLCAGVSTGEEAWSAAMVLAAVYEGTDLPFFVLGWELSRQRLLRARLGRFGRWSARNGFMGYERYLFEVEGGYEVTPELRRHVSFEHVNLVRALPNTGPSFDVIFFRNVSMYWTRALASEVARALGQRLSQRGRLIVGASDPIELPREAWLAEARDRSCIYRRREGSRRQGDASTQLPRMRASVRLARPRAAAPPSTSPPTPPGPEAATPPASASARTSNTSDPSHELIARVRGLADQGDDEQALALIESHAAHTPELLELAGIIELSRGDPRAAIERFRAAVYWAPGVPAHARWLELAIRTRDQLEAAAPPPPARGLHDGR